MTNLNLRVRSDIREWIESRVEKGEFSTAGDYLSELVERDRESRSDEERLEDLRRIVADAEASGISDRTMDEIFAEAVARAKARGTYRE
ncbi:MAG: type II toxin-antitoxin system ParD family antitoxin [Rhizobiales bacterium]|nr:type II toxin-antitoxin system ParD family antitoxin [Hyphomicrobiales bacterium]